MSNPAPVTLLTPTQRFQMSSDNISKHRKLVDAPEFDRAIDFAVNQYSIQLSTNLTDTTSGMIAGFKLAGAQEFIAILKRLAEPPPQISASSMKNLNHNV